MDAVGKRGFTLVEVIVVVAIIAIIAAIAIPSYQNYVRKTKRAEVQAEMMEVASQLQRYKIANFNYRQSVSGSTVTPINLTRVGYTNAAPNSQNNLYQFNLSFNADATQWILSAVPVSSGAQSSDGVSCINDRGQRYWTKAVATAAACTALLSATSNWDGR
ncbi:type IV pilin protein [Acinetobacter terrestris]|uniref:Type IV pilin protein n=1 Tax=Acinetobacter terrestris TaxID=2529843 RepID=A0AAW6UXA3_9GAMM|nr:type IV pilin protein [Acinetobacter terrestris]MDK1684485.1 type IV pilin protein [Acinetobacter terrestris]